MSLTSFLDTWHNIKKLHLKVKVGGNDREENDDLQQLGIKFSTAQLGKIVLLHIFIGSKKNCQEMKVFRLWAAKGHSSYSKFGAWTVNTPKHQLLWKLNFSSQMKRNTPFQNYFPTVIHSIWCILQDWEIRLSPRDPRFPQISSHGRSQHWRKKANGNGDK